MVNNGVLITGATGGLGRVLGAMLLAEGRSVTATGRNLAIGTELAAQGMKFAPADLSTDALAPLLDGVGTIFHLAALSSPWGSAAAFQAANVSATFRLLAAARTAGCQRFIAASTPSIYTRAAHQIGLTEASPLPSRFANNYAASKYAAEQLVLDAVDDGFATVALRPRAIIGPHDTALLPRLLRAADKGVLPLPGGGTALIEPSDARDIARGFIAAEARATEISGRAFNLSSGIALPIAALARHVFDRLGRHVRIVPVPVRFAVAAASVAEMIARVMPGQPEPPITRYGATVLGWSQTFDLSAARLALDWAPHYHPLQSVDWALSEKFNA